MQQPCGSHCPGYPPCHLPKGHRGDHKHIDGQCPAVFKGIQCVLLLGHGGPHQATVTRTDVEVWN